MTKRTTRRKQLRARTIRSKRGGSSELETVISSVRMVPTYVNPNSNFVVVTYWWGRGNLNRNTQRPCPEDIIDPIKEDMDGELRGEAGEVDEDGEPVPGDPEYLELNAKVAAALATLNADQTPENGDAYRAAKRERNIYLSNYLNRKSVMDEIKARAKKSEEKLRAEGKFQEPIKFEVMIANWENACRAANCNFMAVEYPQFAKPGGYQLAINAKPLFIRKALEALEGRAALYIDGDMLIKRYPAIFDIPNVDFMARGWNIDPRGAVSRYKTSVCFDPYIFETSGGTMYFANSPPAKTLLLLWQSVSDKPVNKGKADDRILSLIFTVNRFIPRTNTIQLPLEYLWLSDSYDGKIAPEDMSEADIYITHPECLTGEERAGELSQETASNSREPRFYDKLIESQVQCTRRGGVFYEYIFFPNKAMVSAFAPYLNYMRHARHHKTGNPLFEVVDFDERYGRYTATATRNKDKATTIKIGDGHLPLNADIPTILAHLEKGVNVTLGPIGQIPPLTEVLVTNTEGKEKNLYTQHLKIDLTKPMFFSAKNPIIKHLLYMCATIADINIHLEESYVFMSRIRWSLL